jgi:dihydropteroate synthase
MADVVRRHGAGLVLMHAQGTPATMQVNPNYDDVVREVIEFLEARLQRAIDLGIAGSRVVLDPGVGFGKTLEHNLALLAHLDHFTATGYPVLIGASRKRMIDQLTSRTLGPHAPPTGPDQRLGGTCAITVLAAQAGVAMIRVHDVLANHQALSLWRAVSDRSRTV